MLKHHLLVLAAASLVSVSNAYAGCFADAVVNYDPGIGFVPGYTNVNAVLGEPSRVNPFEDLTDPFNPPYGNNQIISVGAGGSLTLKFNSPVINHPRNRFGIDFIIFGNSGFIITNDFDFDTFQWIGTPATDGSLFAQSTGETRVSVSQDGINFFELNPAVAPTVDNLFPTDGSGDFLTPLDPTLQQSDFVGLTLDQIRALYYGSAGGAGYDISWARHANGRRVVLGAIHFVRISVVSGKSEIDGVAAVNWPKTRGKGR